MLLNAVQAIDTEKELSILKPILMSTAAAAVAATFALTGSPSFADPAHHGDADAGKQLSKGVVQSQGMTHGMMDHGLSMIGPHGVDSALANSIKDRLAITEDQQPAWQAYIGALQDNAEAMRSMHDAMDKVHDPNTSAQDVRVLMDGIHKSQRQALEDVQAAHSALLDVLTDDQKRAARTLVLHGELMGRSMGTTRMMGGQGMMAPCESDTGGGAPSKT